MMNNGEIKFSIIVPIYNVEKYLRQCVDSLVGQSYQNIEIILVDDGSPDNCPKICDEYAAKDKRVKIIHKQNGGVVSARKAGLKEATGEYILCVDGDDYIHPEYVSSFAKVIEADGSDIVFCGMKCVTDDTGITDDTSVGSKHYYSRKEIEEVLFPKLIQAKNGAYLSPSLCAKAFRRLIFEESHNNVPDQLKIAEDAACTWVCIWKADSLTMISDELYFYRQNDSSVTRARKPFAWDCPELLANFLRSQLDLFAFDFREQIDRVIVHNVFNVAITQFYADKPYKEVTRDISQHLNDDFCQEAIQNAEFSGSLKHKLALYALKYRMYPVMYLYSRIK